MWIALALISALCLGFYDVMKKLSVTRNDVLTVLMLNTLFGFLLMSPVIVSGLTRGYWGLGGTPDGHLLILVKALIVLGSWILGYFAIKHLPLTIQGPVNASRPVMVLLGAVIIFGEQLNTLQWTGMLLGFLSLALISRIGAGEGSPYLFSVMTTVIMILRHGKARRKAADRFVWRWTIPLIAMFLTVADMAYFYALSLPGSMIAVVSMIRRGSVLVPFLYGVTVLHERNVRRKAADLAILFVSLALLVAGSAMK